MSDPAVDAAQRAWDGCDVCPPDSGHNKPPSSSVAAAHEALKPVREVVERYENLLNPWDDVGFEILDALRPLVYPTEELT
ncbi:hypothetical protein ACT18_00245 [Mycolicibacter kumamotonensis]|uniref:Uncharacterized protein n=1 Tax=Mycolicibacter kumamotonensis TaxID=354243 RepID=A0A1B8SL25_9MYCO|nr:hypothetical protein ACT18_00245 [Mycolicibacter kumamotonensis]